MGRDLRSLWFKLLLQAGLAVGSDQVAEGVVQSGVGTLPEWTLNQPLSGSSALFDGLS